MTELSLFPEGVDTGEPDDMARLRRALDKLEGLRDVEYDWQGWVETNVFPVLGERYAGLKISYQQEVTRFDPSDLYPDPFQPGSPEAWLRGRLQGALKAIEQRKLRTMEGDVA